MVDFGSDVRKRTLVLCAALALAIAGAVLLRARSRRSHVVFSLFAADLALWYSAQALYGFFQASIWARFTAILSVFLPILSLELFEAILPTPRSVPPRLRRAAMFIAIPVTLLVLSDWHGQGWARGIVYAYVGGFFAAGLYALARRGQRSTSRAIKRRVQYLVTTGALALGTSLAEFLWFIGAELPPVGSALSVIFLFAIAQALIEERLLGLYELFGRIVVATLLAFLLAGIFYLCVTVIGRFSTMYLNAILAAVVVLVLFEPMRQRVEEQIHRTFFRERFDLEQTAHDVRGRLARAVEVDQIATIVTVGLTASRRITGAALYLRAPDGVTFDLSLAAGCEPPRLVEIAALAPLFERARARGPVVLDEVLRERDERGEAAVAGILAAAGTLGPLAEGVIFTLGDPREPVGLWVIADVRVRDAFSPEDVGLLDALAAQLTVALENSRAFVRLKIKDRLAALGQLSAGLAHEIKNPLGAIKGAAELLADPEEGKPLDLGTKDLLGVILEEVDRLNTVVTNVLDYARPPAGPSPPIDANGVLRRTLQILTPDLAGIEVTADLADDLPMVRIDPEKLRQVILNLVQNAQQAMGGRGMVTISSRGRVLSRAFGEQAGRASVEIAVTDEGPGMAPSVEKSLFMPFFTTKPRGTGLGLAISQRIVEAAGGAIEVTTQLDRGSSFRVVLPACEEGEATPRPEGVVTADVTAQTP